VTTTPPSPQRLISDQRGVRYGEVLAVHARDDRLVAEVWGTQMLNDCPAELWDALDPDAITEELGALFVKLNGPRHWVLDGLGTKVAPVEPVLHSFGGLLTRRIAVLDLGTNPQQTPYTIRHVDRGAMFFFDAGKPVHELVDADGTAYVMQAYCVGVDPTLTEDDLPGLSDRLDLPAGWSFRTRVRDDELVGDTTAPVAAVIQDDLEHTYTLSG
jgi:hypothetical protein